MTPPRGATSAPATTANAVLYLRVSSAGQVKKDYGDEGLSLPAQREACTKRAQGLNASVVREFVDPGVSGKSMQKRRAFQDMLEFVRTRGDIDYVIVWSVSRWARDQEDHWVGRGLIRKAGAQLIAVKEPIGGERSSDVMLEGVLAAVAAGQRLQISEDVQLGIQRKVQVGGTPYLVPIGYVNVSRIDDGREIRDVAFDPDRAELVQEAFRLYATGDYSLDELAALLEARGLRSRPNRKAPAQALTPNRLSSMLRNPYYYGIVMLKGKPYPGRHEPLVTEELFDQVQAVLSARRHNGARAWRNHHYLAGTLFCGSCGARLLYSRNRGKGGKTYEYFFCIGKQHGSCSQPYHRLADLERAVAQAYSQISFDREARDRLRRELLDRLEETAGNSQRELDAMKQTLTELARQEKKLLEAFYADSVSPDLFHSEQQRVRRERVAAERTQQTLNGDFESKAATVELGVGLLERPDQAYIAADARSRALMNQGYFSAIYVDDGEAVATDMTPVLAELHEYWHSRWGSRRRRDHADLGVSQPEGQKRRNPHASSWRGGSKVDVLVRARGLEPPRL